MLDFIVTACSFAVAVIGYVFTHYNKNNKYRFSLVGWSLILVSGIGFCFSIFINLSKQAEIDRLNKEEAALRRNIADLQSDLAKFSGDLSRAYVDRQPTIVSDKLVLQPGETSRPFKISNFDSYHVTAEYIGCYISPIISEDGGLYPEGSGSGWIEIRGSKDKYEIKFKALVAPYSLTGLWMAAMLHKNCPVDLMIKTRH